MQHDNDPAEWVFEQMSDELVGPVRIHDDLVCPAEMQDFNLYTHLLGTIMNNLIGAIYLNYLYAFIVLFAL